MGQAAPLIEDAVFYIPIQEPISRSVRPATLYKLNTSQKTAFTSTGVSSPMNNAKVIKNYVYSSQAYQL